MVQASAGDEVSTIQVEVAWARPERQLLVTLSVPLGTTLIEAVQLSGIVEREPQIDLAGLEYGVFGKVLPASHRLVAGDRVELYRPLTINPKAARRARAVRRRAGRSS